MEWENVTEYFSEDERHYRDTYMEIDEVLGDADTGEVVEVSVFSRAAGPYEIFFQFGIMHGVIYFDRNEVWQRHEEIKKKFEKEFAINNKPSSEFIKEFGETYDIDIMNSIIRFDIDEVCRKLDELDNWENPIP